MRGLSDRTAGFTDSVIRRMTRISNECGAINLSQGFPDFDPRRSSPTVWRRSPARVRTSTP